ncbi:hypothetical protein [Streptomyces sp. NPDC059564]|uniref:hypothetical protein n=1 Tax=Streptomyces sp. NPDC059564 TaxID=3346865 RepID=UPI0036902007
MRRFATVLVSATALIALPVLSAQAVAPVVVAGVGGDIGWDSAKPAPVPLRGA